jgi:hypothetical protein
MADARRCLFTSAKHSQLWRGFRPNDARTCALTSCVIRSKNWKWLKLQQKKTEKTSRNRIELYSVIAPRFGGPLCDVLRSGRIFSSCVEVMSSIASEKWENRGNKLAGGVSGGSRCTRGSVRCRGCRFVDRESWRQTLPASRRVWWEWDRDSRVGMVGSMYGGMCQISQNKSAVSSVER